MQLFWKDLLTPELGCLPASGDERGLRFGGLGPVTAGWAVCRPPLATAVGVLEDQLQRDPHPDCKKGCGHQQVEQ